MKGKKGSITVAVMGKALWPDSNLEVGGFHRIQDPARKRWVQSLVIDPQPASAYCGGRHRGVVATPERLHEAEDLSFRVAAAAASPKKKRLVNNTWVSQRYVHDQEFEVVQGFRTRGRSRSPNLG